MPIEVRLINLLTRGNAAASASFIAINEPSFKGSQMHKYTNTQMHKYNLLTSHKLHSN